MAEKRPSTSKSKPAAVAGGSRGQRIPTNEELLHELRKHGVKTAPPMPPPVVSRRTRDYLLIAGIGSAGIGFAALRLLSSHSTSVAVQVALTGIVAFCGLLWFIFFRVMSRY